MSLFILSSWETVFRMEWKESSKQEYQLGGSCLSLEMALVPGLGWWS